MASHGNNFSVWSPLRLDSLNFPIWKIKMKVFLKSVGRDVLLSVEKDFKESGHMTDLWPENISKEFKANAALMIALNDDALYRVINCESHLRFGALWLSHTIRVKLKELIYSHQNMKVFKCMRVSGNVDYMITHFGKITNDIISLGEPIPNDHQVRKIIWPLPKSWEVKTITLKELKDSKEID